MVLLDNGGRRPNEVDLIAPPQDLCALIEHLWIEDGTRAADDWRVVPDASPHLIASVTVRQGAARLSVALVGARSCAASISTAGRTLTAGVRLRPGALRALVGGSAREFVDSAVAIDRAFGGRLLADLELGHDAPPRLILRELMRLVRRALRRRDASGMVAEAAWQARRVAELAARLSTPTRSLRELAHRDVGLSPKRIHRILRLHAALRAATSPLTSWSDVAHFTGYADQAHLIRESRALLGETPTLWTARGSADSFKTPRPNVR